MTKLYLLRKLSVPPSAFARSECAPALLPALVDREHDESRCLTRRCGPRVPLSRGLVPRAHPISRALASGVRAACDRSSRRALLNRFELRTPLSHTSTIEPNVTLLPPTGPHGEAKRPTHGPRPAPPAPGAETHPEEMADAQKRARPRGCRRGGGVVELHLDTYHRSIVHCFCARVRGFTGTSV